MSYTALDTFYLTDNQLHNSPSRKDGIAEATELTLRIYGCNLIQESGILLKLPQQVIATGQVLFQRFYCKISFVHFNVKRIAAASVWLASRVGENKRRAREVIDAFRIIECREEKKPIEYLDASSKEMYPELKRDLTRCELHILRELGFVCHVELPHKLMLSYITVLGTPPGLLQEAWNLASDSLRSTLCVRLKPEVVACGVVYAAARRVHVLLPENPPWWEAFDADKRGIDEVCKVLAHLYSLPKAEYIPVCVEDGSFISVSTIQTTIVPKEVPSPVVVVANTTKVSCPAPKDTTLTIKLAASGKLLVKDSSTESNAEFKAKALLQRKQHKTTSDQSRETQKEKERHTSPGRRRGRYYYKRESEQEKERHTSLGRKRGRDYYEREREQEKERHSGGHRRGRDYYEREGENNDAEWDREEEFVKEGSRRYMIGCQYDAGRDAEKQRRHSFLARGYDGSSDPTTWKENRHRCVVTTS